MHLIRQPRNPINVSELLDTAFGRPPSVRPSTDATLAVNKRGHLLWEHILEASGAPGSCPPVADSPRLAHRL